MHELSIIQSILESALTALDSAGPVKTGSVEAVELQIGELAGVEISTLEFLWPAAVGDTRLADAALDIERVPGLAECSLCSAVFPIRSFYDPCPGCGSHFLQVRQGEELRIKALVLSDKPARAAAPLYWN